jgi:hypothetical protein
VTPTEGSTPGLSAPEVPPAGAGHQRAAWVEVVAAVLLSLAAVATAWSSYQASRWNGEQAKSYAAANAARVEANQHSGVANTQTQIDVATFTEWVDAHQHGDQELGDFYRTRFRPEFAPAFDAWIATKPFDNPDAPLTPFAMPEYGLAERKTAAQLDASAEVSAAQARTDIQRATNYVLAVVLFAAVLFFAGISTKIANHRIRVAILGLGCVFFLLAAAWIATFPVDISI